MRLLLARGVPEDVLLYVDEAYYEFGRHAGGPDALAILRERKGPWLTTRTFSKAYALAALRALNNNPATFTSQRRPIVEFAVEDARAVRKLERRRFSVKALHGGYDQAARFRVMAAFRTGEVKCLIATDVAARGIDVDDVTHVINHTIPEDEKAYLHRVGRTGRAGKTGIAVTFVDWDDLHKWALINKALEMGIPEPVETYSSSPHLFEDLNIAPGTKGRLKPASAAPKDKSVSRPARSSGSGQKKPRTEGSAQQGTSSAPGRSRQRRRTTSS